MTCDLIVWSTGSIKHWNKRGDFTSHLHSRAPRVFLEWLSVGTHKVDYPLAIQLPGSPILSGNTRALTQCLWISLANYIKSLVDNIGISRLKFLLPGSNDFYKCWYIKSHAMCLSYLIVKYCICAAQYIIFHAAGPSVADIRTDLLLDSLCYGRLLSLSNPWRSDAGRVLTCVCIAHKDHVASVEGE